MFTVFFAKLAVLVVWAIANALFDRALGVDWKQYPIRTQVSCKMAYIAAGVWIGANNWPISIFTDP